MHGDVWINGKKAERFRTTYGQNPFATHYNSKLYSRYLATYVPTGWIGANDNYLTVMIDMK